MKNAKANWFIKNSNWFFWVALIPALVLGNICFVHVKSLLSYGFRASYFWITIGLVCLFIANLLFLVFIMYINDDIDGNIKKRVSWFDIWIQKWHLKE